MKRGPQSELNNPNKEPRLTQTIAGSGANEAIDINALNADLLLEIARHLPAAFFRGNDKVQAISKAWKNLENKIEIQNKKTPHAQTQLINDNITAHLQEIDSINAIIEEQKKLIEQANYRFQQEMVKMEKLLLSVSSDHPFLLKNITQDGMPDDWEINESKYYIHNVNNNKYVVSRVIKNEEDVTKLFNCAKEIDSSVFITNSRQGGKRVFIHQAALAKVLCEPGHKETKFSLLAAVMNEIRNNNLNQNMKPGM